MNVRALALVALVLGAVGAATVLPELTARGDGAAEAPGTDVPTAEAVTATPGAAMPTAEPPERATATPTAAPTATATSTPTPEPPTGTPTRTPTATPVPPGPAFSFGIDRIETCGRTCRDVTATVTNERSTVAENVAVRTRIYAGNTTDRDARVWTGRRTVGTLEADESATATERVELGFSEAFAIEREDGWITVVTTIESEGATETFRDRRQVG